MGKMIDQLLNDNAETELSSYYNNFRRTNTGRAGYPICADQPTSTTNQNRSSNIASSLPVRLTRLRRGPRWIATN